MQRHKLKSAFHKPSGPHGSRRFFLFLVAFGSICVFLHSCRHDAPQAENTVVRTAEQNAPLAVLMREMYLDMEEIKGRVLDKEKLGTYLEKHRAMLAAEATDPKVRDSSFHIMGSAYLLHLERMEQSSEEELLNNFQALQQSCVACHQQKCPGPLKKINALKVN